MKQQMVDMPDGKRLYVESWLGGHSYTAILLHGGPGEGCWVLRYLAQLLATQINVVSFDQRGVLRSDGLQPSDAFTADMILDDIETLRCRLALGKVIVIGHSYGGALAARYAVRYPNSVERVIFLCPSFDMVSSMQSVFQKAAHILATKETCDKDLLQRVQAAMSCDSLPELYNTFSLVPQALRAQVYRTAKVSQAVEEANDTDCTEQEWKRCIEHQRRSMMEQARDYTNLLPTITVPMLLVVGKDDPICTPAQQLAFAKSSASGQTVIIEGCAHSPHTEAPHELTQIIFEWLSPQNNP